MNYSSPNSLFTSKLRYDNLRGNTNRSYLLGKRKFYKIDYELLTKLSVMVYPGVAKYVLLKKV